MAAGIFFVMIQTYFQLRFMFRNINDLRFGEPPDIQELRHEITVWQRAAASLSSYSKDEDLVRETLVKKVNRLQRLLKKKLTSGSVPAESYNQTLQDLQKKVQKTSINIKWKNVKEINDLNYLSFCSIQFETEFYWSNQPWHCYLLWASSSCTQCRIFRSCRSVGPHFLVQFYC